MLTIYIYTYSGIRTPKPQKGLIAYRLQAEKEIKGKDGLPTTEIVKDTGIKTVETEGTWNEASLTAVLTALEDLKEPIGCKWFIYTDSLYFEANWHQAFKWRENGWRKKDGTKYEYAEKWEAILKILDECTRPTVSRGENCYSSELKEAVSNVPKTA